MGSDEEEHINDTKRTYTELDKGFESKIIEENDDSSQQQKNQLESETKKDSITVEEILEATETSDQSNGEGTLPKGDNNLYTYCPQCQKHIFIQYKKEHIENAKSFPVYIVWVHGKPFHGLLIRVDKNLMSRGERIVHLEFDSQLTDLYKE